MRPSGTIYKRSIFNRNHGEVRMALPFKVKVFYNYLYFWGTCFIVAAVSGIIILFAPIATQEARYQLETSGVIEKPQYPIPEVQEVKADETDEIQKEASGYGINSEFSIVIPKIDAKSNVIANVDTANEAEYMDALSKGVAHAKGTFFPGQGKPIFLFAHSTNLPINVSRYNAVFYLLSKLEKGDHVIIYFANKKYEYVVTDSVVKPSTDTSFLYDQTNSEKLYLMTCTPPGTSWKRLFVIAEPIQ
jgi:LPXTG-site transpeptidase (sortase) family protein